MKIGNIYEIYSNNKDSFCIGKITNSDNNYIVFEDIDLAGRTDAYCILRKDIITDAISESEYLDLIKKYMHYWKNQATHSPISLNNFRFNDSKSLLLQALQYAYDNKKVVKLQIDNDIEPTGGYIKELNEDSIVVSLVDWSNAIIYDEATIMISNIRFLEFEGIEETLIDYAHNLK